MLEIPLTNDPEQLFNIVLNGANYDIRISLNSRTSVWSISFSQSGVDIVTGVALLGGVDILKQYTLLIENMYMINLDNPSEDPTNENFGIVSKLFILTDEEVSVE